MAVSQGAHVCEGLWCREPALPVAGADQEEVTAWLWAGSVSPLRLGSWAGMDLNPPVGAGYLCPSVLLRA